ncbi:MAG: response regulator [Bacteroidota bacterium]|nr:response regulator [Bacteroidota bacterium]
MVFFAATLTVMFFIACLYYYTGINGVKIQNHELRRQVEDLNKQLDFHAEKEAKARREAEIAFKAKGKLLSLLSHEIRTPMNGVIGMATLMAGTELNTEQREYANTILDCSTKLLTNVNDILINDMLDFSKVDTESVELGHKKFDLRNCIEEVMGIMAGKAAEASSELLYGIDQNVPMQITGDYKRLQQVLINLLENAVNATKNGEILLKVSLNENIENIEGEQVRLGFTVSDTGSGISRDKLPHLFKGALPADYSTKDKKVSKGFGLVICKRLVEQMGGAITLETSSAKGTVFIFSIVTTSSEGPAADDIKNRMIGFEGKQVLIVDDNATALSILSQQLEEWKFLPVLASSGKQALEILSQISVDLVLTDLLMPDMDGVELSQSIRAQYSKTPVILLNAVNAESYKPHAAIFSAVISKPLKQHVLLDSILTGVRHNDQSSVNGSAQLIPDNFSEKYPLHILVAEDNPVNQKWIRKILSKIGYKCEIAENGKVVMEKVSLENYDLILMDVQMPEMDGLEATKMIRLCLQIQPVIIAMTANAMQGDRDECIQSGMNDYISKPVELNVLLNMLEKWALLIKEKKQNAVKVKNVV